MTGRHFFVEVSGGQWHRTEGDAERCACGIWIGDARILKMRGHDDDSWMWVPPRAVASCFPETMRKPPKQADAMAAAADRADRLQAENERLRGNSNTSVNSLLDSLQEAREERDLWKRRATADWSKGPHFPSGAPLRKVDFATGAPEKCQECGWANVGLMNYGEPGKPRWMCHGCAARTIRDVSALDAMRGESEASKDVLADFIRALEFELAGHLPEVREGAARTMNDLIDAVSKVVLALDAHEDASTPAFDEIAGLCGCPQWDYPGQLVRDVERVVNERDELREKLRTAEAVRDDARAASQRYLDETRRAREFAEGCSVRIRSLEDERDRLQRMLDQAEKLRAESPQQSDVRSMLGEAFIAGYHKGWERGSSPHLGGHDGPGLAFERWIHKQKAIGSQVGDRFLQNEVDSYVIEELTKQRDNLQANYDSVSRNLVEVTKQKDTAYTERDRCVAGLAALAVRLGWSAWLGKHPADEKWDDDWRWIVFINLPTGQVSWHIHDTEVQWFGFLTYIPERPWDGHTTEQKYKRLAQLGRGFGEGRVEKYEEPESEHDQYDRATGDLGAPLAETLSCSCSPKYIELAPGVHAKYCPLGGQPLDDGRKRWRCEPCNVTYRAAVGEVTPVDRCMQCGQPTTEVSR